ncbi:hypothetical protein BDD12DRAFT_805873 [Trichophaea hybrida]|nr:hypothetical protein BDD12DRAFT_805873 [Trichophaea hybrida]
MRQKEGESAVPRFSSALFLALGRPSDNQANKLWQELASYYVEALVGNQAGIPDPRKLLGQRLKQRKAVKFNDKDTKDASGIVDYPYQLDIADWWSRGPPGIYFLTNSLDRALCIAIGKSRRTVILSQLELNSRHSPNEVDWALNLESTNKLFDSFPLKPPSWVPDVPITWNVTHAILGGRKLWLLWDPSDQSYSAVKAYYDNWVKQASTPRQPGSTVELDATICELVGPRLKNAYIAETDGTTALYIPAGWYHEVFTLKGGFLTGYMMPSTRKVEALVRNFEAECNVAPQEPKMSKLLWDDISANVPIILETIIQLAKDRHDRRVSTGMRGFL